MRRFFTAVLCAIGLSMGLVDSPGGGELLYCPDVMDRSIPVNQCCVCDVCIPCNELKMPLPILKAIAEKESGCVWRLGALGEVGYMQIMPRYYTGNLDLQSKEGNIRAADEILFNNLRNAKRDINGLQKAIQRYNPGDRGYSRDIIRRANNQKEGKVVLP